MNPFFVNKRCCFLLLLLLLFFVKTCIPLGVFALSIQRFSVSSTVKHPLFITRIVPCHFEL